VDKLRRRVVNRTLVVRLDLAAFGMAGCGRAPAPVAPLARRTLSLAPPRDVTRALAIVALTASAFEEDRAAILKAGSDQLLRKPVELRDRLLDQFGFEHILAICPPRDLPATKEGSR
jgi:CheY-like chemotaxis protein